jgi:mevalonate kinase
MSGTGRHRERHDGAGAMTGTGGADRQNEAPTPNDRLPMLEIDLACKWMLAGEYAVLSPGGMALAVAVRPGFVYHASPMLEDAILEDAIPAGVENGEWVEARSRAPDLPPPAEFTGDALVAVWRRGRSRRRRNALVGLRSNLQFVSPEVPGPRPGTSAALSLATVWAVDHWLGLGLSVEKRISIARKAHAATQRQGAPPPLAGAGSDPAATAGEGTRGTGGSGYDVNTIGLGGVVLTRASAPSSPESRHALPGIWLVAARAHKKTPTVYHLALFDRAMSNPMFRRALTLHVRASNALVRWLWGHAGAERTPDFAELAARVDSAEQTLRQLSRVGRLGVFSREVQALLAVARKAGLPARVSGGGRGDAVVAFAPDGEVAERLSAGFAARGWSARVLPPDSPCGGPETLVVSDPAM